MANPEKTAEAVAILAEISTPNISDAMMKGLSRVVKYQTMDAAIKPLDPSFRLCAPAYSVCCYPGATYAMEKAVAEAPAGSAIVCNSQGSTAGVMIGELMSAFARQRGVKGAVVDGSVRDIDDIIAMNFPVFTRHITPQAGTYAELGEVQITISCGGVSVNPGDIVCADRNGVVVVPQAIATQVALAAKELAEWEDVIKQRILAGDTLAQAAQSIPRPAIQKI